MVITEVILNMERSGTSIPVRNLQKTAQPTVERNDTEDMDPKLEKAFRLSDQAFAAGDGAKAMAYLKKASQLFPDEPEIEERLNLLKTRIQAENLVNIGLKKLEEGDIRKAVAASRKAFHLLPDAEGLSNLLSLIEKAEGNSAEEPAEGNNTEEPISTVKEAPTETGEVHSTENSAMLWADRFRAAVKDEKFEEAGKMVSEAVKSHPNHPLLDSFHAKLKRLGFAE